MECFCHKISNQRFQDITESETAILRVWANWAQSTRLLQPNPLTPPDEQLVARRRGKRHNRSSTPRAQKLKQALTHSHSINPILDQPQLPPHVIPVPPESIHNLVKSYSHQNAVKAIGAGSRRRRLDIPQGSSDSPIVNIFLAIERNDLKIEAQQLLQRTYYYGFALLHQKKASIDPIVHEIQNALPHVENNIREKVYYIIRIGEKWKSILSDFASIVECETQHLRGLLCLLGSASTWERARPGNRQSALRFLFTNTDILERTLQYTPLINQALYQISLEHSFVDETRGLASYSQPALTRIAITQSDMNCPISTAASACRSLHTPTGAEPAWVTSLAAASGALPESGHSSSEDAKVLLLILSCLSTSDKVPISLFHGVLAHKRWNTQGHIEEVEAYQSGIAPELHRFLSDTARLTNAFQELHMLSAIIENHDKTYNLKDDVADRVREGLCREDLSFWNHQALIVAYRAIPWKYIDSVTPNTKLFLPHLKHVLHAFQGCYETLPVSTRVDLVLTLVEASRFPNMAWKRFAIHEAKMVSNGLKNQLLDCCIAQSQSLINRISGNMGHAASSIGNFVEHRIGDTVDKRMHSAIGLATIQHSLDCIQVEDLSTAKQSLEEWRPLDQDPSPIEQVICFRKDMLLGRILRFQGAFHESLTHLQRAHKTTDQCNHLTFDEDLRDLTTDYADTLRELDDPSSAEHLLRTEIVRREQTPISSGQSLLELSLAESLFAQRRFQEAEKLCLEVQSRPSLLKLEKLRLHITMAKLHHVQSDYEAALSRWSEAMKEIRKFELTNGRTTRMIVMSICDTLGGLGQTWLMNDSLKQVASLDELAKPGGVHYWIAGMRHWLHYLNRGLRSHM